MSLYDDFAINIEKIKNGVPVEYAPNGDGTIPTFRISRKDVRSNKRYAKVLEIETRPYRRQLELETLDSTTADKLHLCIFVKGILVGWDNVQDENDNPIEFNTENAMALFKQLPELYADLDDKSIKASLFRDETIEREAKN